MHLPYSGHVMLKATARKKPIAPPPKPLLAILPFLFIRHWRLPTSWIFFFQISTQNSLVAASFGLQRSFYATFFVERPFGLYSRLNFWHHIWNKKNNIIFTIQFVFQMFTEKHEHLTEQKKEVNTQLIVSWWKSYQ